jgi:hypothetical protein
VRVNIENEIKDLQLFGYALRKENRKLFEQMMSELEPEILEKASLAKNPFEVIARGLIFQLQNIIKGFIKKIGP